MEIFNRIKKKKTIQIDTIQFCLKKKKKRRNLAFFKDTSIKFTSFVNNVIALTKSWLIKRKISPTLMEFGFAPLVGGSGWKMKGSEGEGVPLLRTGEDEGGGAVPHRLI